MKTEKNYQTKIESIEYWLDGVTSSFQVTKEDYYNSYQNRTGFIMITYSDGSQRAYNRN